MQDCILYARFSPRPQKSDVEECESIEFQLDRLQRYCDLAQLQPQHVIRDPYTSAGTPLHERPGGQELLSLLSQPGAPQHVVVQKLDRCFRDAVDCLVQVRQWNARGVSLHLADQGGCSIDTSTPLGWFILGQLALQAELERKMIGERTQGAMRRHQSNGRRMGGVPYGFKPDPDDKARIVECPVEQANIHRMRELKSCGHSLRRVADILCDEGVLNRKGECFHHNTIKKILARPA